MLDVKGAAESGAGERFDPRHRPAARPARPGEGGSLDGAFDAGLFSYGSAEYATPQALLGLTTEPLDTLGEDQRVIDPLSPAEYGERADAAAHWLSGEIVGGTMPGFSPDFPDWGLTIDTLWALAAADAERATADEIAAEVEAHVADFATFDAFDIPGVRVAGAMSKELLTAAVLGADPHDFGGYDVRQEVLDMVAGPEAGVEEGRVRDVGTGSDSTNLFSQSFAVLGLARTGGVPEQAVQFMLRQQCADGYFRIFYNDQLTCDEAEAAPDRDATAMAVQALISARDHGVTGLDDEIDLALDWFEEDQRPDGSFGGGVTTEGSNTNSSGLVAQALRAGGPEDAYRDAAAWVSAMQIAEEIATGLLAEETGAIAYNADDLQAAIESGLGGTARGAWRRATPQAIFAFAPVPLGELTLGEVETDPDPDSSPSPSPSPDPDPSPSPIPDPDPNADPKPTPSPHSSTDSDSDAAAGFQLLSDDSGPNGDGGSTPSPTPSPTASSPSPSTSPLPSPTTESPSAPEDDETDADTAAAGSPGDDPSRGVPPQMIAIAAGVLLGTAVIGGQFYRRRRA